MITILFTLLILGVILWLINTYVPMAQPIKTIFNVIVVIIVCIWLLQFIGIVDYSTFPVRGRLR